MFLAGRQRGGAVGGGRVAVGAGSREQGSTGCTSKPAAAPTPRPKDPQSRTRTHTHTPCDNPATCPPATPPMLLTAPSSPGPADCRGASHTAHLAAHRPQNERPLRTRSQQAGNTGSNPTLVRASHARSPRSLRGTDPPWYLRRSPPAPRSRVFCSVSVLDTQERAPSRPA